MITVRMEGLDRLTVSMIETGEKITTTVKGSLLRTVIKLQRYIVTKKLQGGSPLHHRTGNLQRATVYTEPVQNSDGSIVVTVGTSNLAPYGRVHEFGGQFTIREHLRTSKNGKSFTVRAHLANFPERSYLRSSLAENKAQIQKDMEEAIRKALQ
jgi:phage gpG-like protein